MESWKLATFWDPVSQIKSNLNKINAYYLLTKISLSQQQKNRLYTWFFFIFYMTYSHSFSPFEYYNIEITIKIICPILVYYFLSHSQPKGLCLVFRNALLYHKFVRNDESYQPLRFTCLVWWVFPLPFRYHYSIFWMNNLRLRD